MGLLVEFFGILPLLLRRSMKPRDYLSCFRQDPRLVTGGFYPTRSVHVREGGGVGVLLLNMGGVTGAPEVENYLYSFLMNPAALDLPIPRFLRAPFSRMVARHRARQVARNNELIGGGSPLHPHMRDQARELERRLNATVGKRSGVQFRTYLAMRHGTPSLEQAAQAVAADGVDALVMLPLHPQYSKTTTGALLHYWNTLESVAEVEPLPTTTVLEYAAHPKFVRALNERIDEGLQRFPREVRDRVYLVFSASGTRLKELKRHGDPYCCLVHSSVDRVMALRRGAGMPQPFRVGFQGQVEPLPWLGPHTSDVIEELADQGVSHVLAIPIDFISDQTATAYQLDIAIRRNALKAGIEQFEVMSGLNCHPLFIEALADIVSAQVRSTNGYQGNGSVNAATAPPSVGDLSPHPQNNHRVRCRWCELHCEALEWPLVEETPQEA